MSSFGPELLKNLRYAVRVLWQNPGFTIVSVLSLALGIGVNTAIFSLIDAVLLRNLPVADPESLVFVSDPASSGVSIGLQGGERSLFSFEEFRRMRDRNQVFTGMFGSESDARTLNISVGGGSPEEVRSRLVTGDYFSILGIKPTLGRAFTMDDEKAPGSDPYLVISHKYWKKRFGLDASILGKTIQINKTYFTVIGVAPERFFGETVGESPDLWIPMMMEPQVKLGRDWLHDDPAKAEKVMWLHAVGRLKPGVSLQQAQSSMNVLFQQILRETTGSNLTAERARELSEEKIKVQPGSRGASPLRDQFSQPLLVLMTVVGLVLLIACANVANLLLARATARSREIGIRIALGASRTRLVVQLMTESILLAMLGGVFGILLAFWGSSLLLRMVSHGPTPIPLDVHPDLRMLAFTAAVSILTGVLFGLAPALRATRVDVSATLKDNARGVVGSSARITAGKALVVAQVAISLLLLIGAGLFLRTLRNLQNVDLGYSRDKLVLARIDPLAAGYQGARRAAVYTTLLDRFRSMPGVRGVALSENGLFGGTESADQITVEGYKPQKRGDDNARFDQVGPNYFSTVGIPMLLGREIGPQDSGAATRACVINESMAKFYFGKQNPIGKHITDEFPDTKMQFEIVGVSRDDRDHKLRGDVPRRFYVPLFHGLGDIAPAVYYELRTVADPASVIASVRRVVAQVDPTIPVMRASSLGDLLDGSLTQERVVAQLSLFFGGLALLLASVGLYGVLSYSIARRTNEIGIRMALGAQQGAVLSMVFRETMIVVATGIGIGLPLAIIGTRFISSQLYGLNAADPLTIAVACMVLASVAMLACYLPARRASKVDPLIALRYE